MITSSNINYDIIKKVNKTCFADYYLQLKLYLSTKHSVFQLLLSANHTNVVCSFPIIIHDAIYIIYTCKKNIYVI